MSTCKIVTVERQHTAVVRDAPPFDRIREAQRTARAKLTAVLPTLDTGALGRTCTRWTPPADGKLPMEIGTIVARGFESNGVVVALDLPAGINWEIYGATQDAELYVLLA